MINEYLDSLNIKDENEYLSNMYEYASLKKIPVITYEGISIVKQIIKLKSVKKVLELGTAIGYSACAMSYYTDCDVVTIERNYDMYCKAVKNVNALNLNSKINIINDDALNVDETKLGKFDLIFIDAAKAQYIKFFEKYENNLNDNGVIVCDNLIFHGLVIAEIKDRNLKQLVRKIKTFNEWLINNDKYDTFIYSLGDGMSISIKK